jgi:hypothetical protein
LDGGPLGLEDTAAPYEFTWNTATAANGAHTLAARARDGNGNVTTSAGVSITVSNASVGLLAAYSFNEGSGTTLGDLSGNGRTGTITGATWTAGKFGQALNFDGNDFVSLGDLDVGTAFTLMGWMQTRTLHVGTCGSFLMKALDYGLEICGSTLYAEVGNGGPGWSAAVTRPLTSSDLNVWRHVAMTYSGTTLRLYVDGVLIGQANGAHTSNNTPLIFGRWTPSSEFWNGLVDEVRLYSRALTLAEIQTDMNAPVGNPPSGSPPVLANPGPQANDEGTAISLQLSATDPDGDAITYSASGLPPDLAINPSTGLITGTLVFTSAGSWTVNITATANGQSDTELFTWTVADINRPPALINPGNQTNAETAFVSLLLTGNDADGDTVTYSAVGLPPSLTVNAITGVVSGTLAPSSSGTYDVTARAHDGNFTTGVVFTWTVTSASGAPSASVTAPAGGATVSGAVVVRATAADDAGVLGVQFLLDGAPLGGEDTAAPYEVTWNSLTAVNGAHVLTARARDANGNMKDSTGVSVTVANTLVGLLAAYSFDEGAGTLLGDASGNNRTGTITGATWTAGKFGQALNFDGNDFVDLSDFDLAGPFTLMGWIQTRSLHAGGCASMLMKAFDYGVEICQSALHASVGNGGWSRTVTHQLTSADLNTWKHVAITYDGTTLRVYINGTLVGQGTGAHNSNNNPLLFGRWTPAAEFWNGLIDEVRIFNRALTQAEVQNTMNVPIGG